jgi:hypothetical protein
LGLFGRVLGEGNNRQIKFSTIKLKGKKAIFKGNVTVGRDPKHETK